MCRMERKARWRNDWEVSKKIAECFGQIYRSHFDKNATPKLHLLEVHAPMELCLHKRLKLFPEDSIEREHLNNKGYSIFFRMQKLDASSAKENLRNENILLVLQKCDPQSRKWPHRQSGASPLRARRDLIRSENQDEIKLEHWEIVSPKFTRCCNFSWARWP